MTVERRKFERREVPESSYFVFDHDTSEMAMIRDIGPGGLKFEYVSTGKDTVEWRRIDIFGSGGNRFHLFGISCRQVYTIEELAEKMIFSGSRTRTSGLKFLRLNNERQKKLKALIDQL